MLKGLIGKVVGDPNEREIKKLQPLVDAINALEPQMERRSDAELRALTERFKAQVRGAVGPTADKEMLDGILVEAFAAVREAAKRHVDMRPFDVQLIGGIVLHQGKVAEMRTGEGKTLVATMPIYLNALLGQGVHLVTVNDYLARRDALWMGRVYHALGLSVGLLQSGSDQPAYVYDPTSQRDPYPGLRPVPRKQAYAADVTYGTNNEFGFDYLRDNLALSLDRRVQRPLYYAIVDEVDNIFIDEARTPLIISGASDEPVEEYGRFAVIAKRLEQGVHYELDDKERSVYLTDEGLALVEQETGIENIYDEANYRYVHYMQQALKAEVLFQEGKDYIRQRKEIILIDQHTGRLMPSRRLSEGLHQAIEAKEGVPVQPRDVTSATITIQNYFRMYKKLAGMSGTAVTEGEEFYKIYHLDVLAIPTNKPVARQDHADVVYRTEEAKLRAVAREILACYSRGQPVLVGTTSVEMSERLSRRLAGEKLQMAALSPQVAYALQDAKLDREAQAALRETMNTSLETMNSASWRNLARDLGLSANALTDDNLEWIADYLDLRDEPRERRALEHALREGIAHEVLNAKEHTREAAIIARAGEPGAVTIATNMAGRGVDIKLGGELSDETIHRAVQALETRGLDPYTATGAQMDSAIAEVLPEYARRREHVLAARGLHVLGTERHEARRIDNQLRGRAGRQGEPGSSRFYLSLEDDLMRRFGRKEMLSRLMETIGDDFPIEHNLVSKTLERAQQSVEGYNFELRKHLLEYDDVLNRQRETIYDERLRILKMDDLRVEMWRMLEAQVDEYMEKFGEDAEQRNRLFIGMDDVVPLLIAAPKAPFQGAVTFGEHYTAFPPFTIGLVADQLAGRPVDEVCRELGELARDAAADYSEQFQKQVSDTARAVREGYDERLERYRALLDEKIDDYMQLLEERQQELEPRRLAQHLERTYPLRLTMPDAAEHPEIDTFDDLRDYWAEEIEVQFHRQTVHELIDRARGRLPGEAAAGLDRLRASRLPADKLAEEVGRVRDLAAKQVRERGAQEMLARHATSDLAAGQVLAFVDAVKVESDVEVGRLDRLVSHALGAFVDDLIAGYIKELGDEPAMTRDLERLQASVVEGRKGGRVNTVLEVLGQLADALANTSEVELEIDTVEEVLNAAGRHEFDKWAQRQIAEIEGDARQHPLVSTEWAAVVEHLLATHYTERQAYGKGHQRQVSWSPRLPFSLLASSMVEDMDVADVRAVVHDSLSHALKLRETVWGRQELKRWGQATLDDLAPDTYDGLLRYLGAEELGGLREQTVDDLPPAVYQQLRFVLAMRRLEEANPALGDLPGAEALLAEMGRSFEETVLDTPVNRLEPALHDALIEQLQSTGYLDAPAVRQALQQQPIGQWDAATRDEVARYLGQRQVADHQAMAIDHLPAPIGPTVIAYLERQRRFLDEARVQDFLVHRHLSDLPAEMQDRALRHVARTRLERLGRRKISNLDVETRQVVVDSLQRQGLFHDEARRRAVEGQSLAALDAGTRGGIGISLAREQISDSAVGDLPADLRQAAIDQLTAQGLLASPERLARLPEQRLPEIDTDIGARVQKALGERLRADLAARAMEELPGEVRSQVHQVLAERDYFVDPEKVSLYERKKITQLPVEMLQGLEEALGRARLNELSNTPWGDLPQATRDSVLTFLTRNGLLADRAEELRLTQSGRLAELSNAVRERVARHLGREWLVSIRDRRPTELAAPESRLVHTCLRDRGYFSDEFKEELFALQRLEEFGPEAAAAIERDLVYHLNGVLAGQAVGSLPAEVRDAVQDELRAAGYFVDEARMRQVLETPVSQLAEEVRQAIYAGVSAYLLSRPAGDGRQTDLKSTPISELPGALRSTVFDYLTGVGYFVDEKKRGEVLDRRLDDLPEEQRAAVIDDLAAYLDAVTSDRPVAELSEDLRQALREALEVLGYFASDEVRRQVLAQPLSGLSRADLEAVAEAAGREWLAEWAALRLEALPGGMDEAVMGHLQARGWFLDKERLEQIESRPLGELKPEVRHGVLDVLRRRHQDQLRQQPLGGLDREGRRQVRDLLRQRGLAAEESALRPLQNQVVDELDGDVYRELLRDMGRQVVHDWGRRPFAELDEGQQGRVAAYLGRSVMGRIERQVLLHTISRLWIDYLTDIEDLRRGIGLEAYGQRDPLVEYKRRAFELFEELGHNVRRTAVRTLFRYAAQPLEGLPER